MTGHVCPECGAERPGCACAQAELAAAEDFDPLRIRPYVTLESGDDTSPYGSHGTEDPYGGDASSYGADDPPTAQLAAIRPDGGPSSVTAPMPGTYGAEAHGAGTYGAEAHGAEAHGAGTYGAEAHGAEAGPGTHAGSYPGGDPSETMPLLLGGAGAVPPPPGHDRGQPLGRGRRRGAVVAVVAAAAVAGTAALAAALLGGGEERDDRADVPEVTTSASLNIAVSEAPSPSSESPHPTSSSPTARPTSASPTPTPTASRTTDRPSASPSATGPAAPPTASSSAPATAPTPTEPSASASPSESPGQGEVEVTLSLGASGHEVKELQRRLTAVWVYDGPVNGRYDEEVREAVARYQTWHYGLGDPEGVYGPATRRVLEESTPHI
ncbi:peptidoglycan-binding protein [Streptomyces exfoliatus]|uniref:Peptidoglycan-binding protein n=1 Tax=Streptomyces exfoliatus TaxID=1905 RepID=A0ABV3D6D4_STREX